MGVTSLKDNYTGVPDVASQGGGGEYAGAHATPESFGAGVGAAEEKAGNTGFDVAQHYQGLINETAMNDAEVGFVKSAGDLKAKYQQYEGLQAEAMRPKYEADLQALHAQYRRNLPPIVQRAYDQTTLHQMAYQTNEFSSYAAGQVKSANINSLKALSDNSVASASNLGQVLDDNQVANALGTISHAGNGLADHKGLGFLSNGVDPQTGDFTYPDTPEGQQAKAQHLEFTNAKKGEYFTTAAKTIADNMGPTAAADWVQKQWHQIPDVGKVQLNQFLAPKVKNEIMSGNVASMSKTADQAFTQQMLANVPDSPTAIAPKTVSDPLSVIRENEGYTGKIGRDSNGAGVLNGINEKAFPTEYAEAKNLLDTKGKAAADTYADNFYQKNILDKYDIKSLPANTQAIVADGLVNHGAGTFGQSLIQAAKDGFTPEQLIAMRRAEYKRLADSDTDGSKGYSASLEGWDNRLDKLQQGAAKSNQTFQSAPNKADFLRSNEDALVNDTVESYLKKYPDDHYGAQLQEKRARTEVAKQINIEDGKLRSDRDVITNAISGGYTKGEPPATYEDLKNIKDLQPVLDRVHAQQGKWSEGIDTMVAKAAKGGKEANTPNGYNAIMQTLDASDAAAGEGHLHSLFARDDQTGINFKDYQDGMKVNSEDYKLKSFLSRNMRDIANAGGNVDGQGQQRALQFYHAVLDAKTSFAEKGTSLTEMLDPANKKGLSTLTANYITPRAEQIKNAAEKSRPQQSSTPTFTDKAQYDAAPSGTVYLRNGIQYRKP